ncbi:tetratricopeptide repeat protein [Allorhizocola rhizosphaerae]|uniref:tetratricopeptide repeat protein n=1 Tax=Allorhizocola rhizosphaerae TaxID=1872709 RepID=UPI0013C30BDD|nr:tetratricopeptide repeat protein [Allorhizocola rhizosphaerae]
MVDVTEAGLTSHREVDVVVLTALAEECDAVLAVVGEANCEVFRRAGGDVYVASVGALRVAVTSLHGMGNVGASATARALIEVWRPTFLVLVGIAAGIRGYAKDLRSGDVLVADQVVGFELAKVTEGGLHRRYQSFPPPFDLLAAARSVAASEWPSTIATPRPGGPGGPGVPGVYVGAVLSGEKVFADLASVQELSRVWPTAVGVEMEGLGVAIAAHRGGCGFLLVKGVSDFADARKDDRWRRYAAEAAARFALAVLRRQPVATARTSWPRPVQLPRDATWFTGRAAELEQVLTLAMDPRAGSAVVISAIDGMAGIGKTALAVHAAHRLASRFPDGQLFVDLHGFTAGVAPVQAAEALDRVLRDIGVPGERIPAGVDERAALWRTLLARRRMLIVLDNAATEAQVQPLLPGSPGCLVLVTSRRRLAALEAGQTVSLDTLPQADAVRLFTQTAGRAELTTGTPQADAELVEVMQLCGCLPLAIRIAAARLKNRPVWTVADLAERLRGQDVRLTALDDGQRSVHATLHLSYQHLSADAQRLYRLLGLHPGPELEPYAAAALVDSNSLQEVQRWLDELVDGHLLAEPARGRYRFHDLVRAHAATAAADEEPGLRQRAALERLLEHYRHSIAAAMDLAYPYDRQRRPAVAPVGTSTPLLAGRHQAELWLDTELDNLLAAVHLAAQNGWPEHTWHMSAILDRHLRTRGRYRDARTLHEHAVNLAQHFGHHAAEMDALIGLGYVHWRLSDYQNAGDYHAEALQIAQAIGHRGGEMDALTGLGEVQRMQGRFEEAGDNFGRALKIAQAIGDRVGELSALTGLGYLHLMLERFEQAGDDYVRALQIAQAIGDQGGEVHALNGLGEVHLMLGNFEQAGDRDRQALQIARAIGDQGGEIHALNCLGAVQRTLGRFEQAGDDYVRALQIARAIGERRGEKSALNGLGHVHRMLGRFEQAADHFGPALQIAQATGDPMGQLQALTGLGHSYRMLHRHSQAADCFHKVLVLARQIHSSNWQGEALHGFGRLHHATGQFDLALTCHERALQYAIDLAQPTYQARAHDGLAHVYHATGQYEQARQHWQHALNILTSVGTDYTDDLEANVPNIRAHLMTTPVA